jgi:endonuclease/exonuclease/phosphatase family metal-dependent hydrolase
VKKATFLKLLSAVLCLVTLVSMLPACNNGGDGNVTTDDITTEAPETEAPEPDPLNIITNGTVNYEIIYPTVTDLPESNAVTTLRRYFKTYTGLEIRMSNDSKTEDTVTNKIIIGRAKYDEVQKLFGELKYHDYKVVISGSNIIIAAYTKEGYDKALNYVTNNILTHATGSGAERSLTVKVNGFSGTDKADYKVKSWTIAGNALGNYKIIYGNKDYYDSLVSFRDTIAEQTGYYLDVLQDTKADPSPYEILIGDTNREESKAVNAPTYLAYNATVKNSKLVIKSGGAYSTQKLLSSLYTTLVKGKTEIEMGSDFVLEGNYLTDTLDSSKPADSNLRIMSCNILAEFPSWTTDTTVHPYLPVVLRKEILFSAIDYYQPTIIGFQEFTMAWYEAMDDYRDADKWELIKFKNAQRTDGEYVFSTVMFRKDLYTLVESGTKHYSKHNNARCRLYTWVVLKDNATGKEFTFASTHWDGAGREHGFLQVGEFVKFINEMKKRGPVFTTGDFNSNEISAEYEQFLKDADILDAKLNTLKKVNDIGSWHNFCKSDFSWGSCDHITATKDTTVQKYQTITGNETIYGSDHCWIIADIKFN